MRVRLIGIALLFSAAVWAQEPSPNQAARAAFEAYKAKDKKLLASLAAKNKPDPWVVADELCYRRAFDAAAAFAKAAPRKDTEKLPAYVESQRGTPQNLPARKIALAALKTANAGRPGDALKALDAIDTTLGDVFASRTLVLRGKLLRSMGKMKESADAFVAAAEVAEKIGWLKQAGTLINESSRSAYNGSDWPRAIALLERSIGIAKTRGSKRALADALGNLAVIYNVRGEYAKALEYQRRSLEITERPTDRAATLMSIGNTYRSLGSYTEALDYTTRALAIFEKIGDRRGAALALGNVGNTYDAMGQYPRALEHFKRGLKIAEELEDGYVLSRVIMNIAGLHASRGDFANALLFYERARKLVTQRGDQNGVAVVLGNMGRLHSRLGDDRKALAYEKAALAIHERTGNRPAVASSLLSLGEIYAGHGKHAAALDCLQRSRALSEELGNRAGVARAFAALGNLHYRHNELDQAKACHERALTLAEEMGDRDLAAKCLANIAGVHGTRGEADEAIALFQRVRAMALETGSLHLELKCLVGIAGNHRAARNLEESVRYAREGVEKLPLILAGLGDEQGAQARDQWLKLLETGVRSAGALGDTAGVTYFVENGRAGALLESLGGRKALSDATIPAPLREEELRTREAVAKAQESLGRALKARSFKAARAARKELDQARAAQLDVVARIQRAAKAAADVAYPRAATLKEIQGSLREGDALVSYVFVGDGTAALVVTSKTSRLVPLVQSAPLEQRLADLDVRDRELDMDQVILVLRDALIDPLELDASTKRLLISPAGAISYVPFSMLLPDREVVYVPSGTTYGVLLDEREKRGKGVLALGDPVYEATRRGSIHRTKLEPLPATRDEVKAIGDVVLLGKEATEARLAEALAEGEGRWRAVHLACHGLVSPDQPTLSALALSVGPDDDGFLTALEVFKMKIPADLTVLSACETAKGKVYLAEGVIGFTRAFMMAGAPRVIVSLWPVEDKATHALMVKFYELWSPSAKATGDKHPLPAATALKKAQEFVASHEQWKHPSYWAAWQLWGLPD